MLIRMQTQKEMLSLYTEDFKQFAGQWVRVTRVDGTDYVGVANYFRDHDETSLPGSDVIGFVQPNTGRRVDIFRAEINDITVVCKE